MACLSNPIQCNWLYIYGGHFPRSLGVLCRFSDKLRRMISIRVQRTHHMISPSQIQESSTSIKSLKMLIWQMIRFSDKSIHADSMEHLQMCHLNGNNDDKEKGERGQHVISSFHENTCRPAQGPIMGPGGDIFSGTFRETCQLPESGSGLKQRGKWVPQPRQQSGVTLVSFAWQLPLRSQKTSNNAHSEIIISR